VFNQFEISFNMWATHFSTMKMSIAEVLFFLLASTTLVPARAEQYILFCVGNHPSKDIWEEIHQDFNTSQDARVRVGVAGIFSYLDEPAAEVENELRRFLQLAQQNGLPVVVQLDGENWWRARPDLWNWWDPSQPGYSPGNCTNVEWSGWSSSNAVKIAWRDWGDKIRVLPPPNLMSPAYRSACHEEMRTLVPIVVNWWQALPPDRKDLFVGLKVGWESSIGVNAWYYPNGNELVNQPSSNDFTNRLNMDLLPARGVAAIGYAAVETAGIRSAGELREADLAEVIRLHLTDLCRVAAGLGIPREKLFTHTGGWKENELLFESGLNSYSCPGWSFYRYAANPKRDVGVQNALKKTDAPFYAAAEWLYQGPRETVPWENAIAGTLANPRCKYMCVFNWRDICNSPEIIQGVREEVGQLNQGAPATAISGLPNPQEKQP